METALIKPTTTQDIQIWKQDWMAALRSLSISGNMTFPELWKLDTPSVSLLNYGEKSTEKGEIVFQKLVLKIVEFFGGNWSEDQILDCGKVCFDEWHYLTFAELAHFSQKCKSGGFKEPGKSLVYGQFVPATLIDWFCQYAADNLEDRANYFSNKRGEWAPPANPVRDEVVNQVIGEVSEWFTELNKDESTQRQEQRKITIETQQEKLKKQLVFIPEVKELMDAGMTRDEAIKRLLELQA